MLAPHELKQRTFTKAVRGYNANEVDEYINFIIDTYSELYIENAELEKKLTAATEKLNELQGHEEALKSTIVKAQKIADEIVRDANDKAKLITGSVRDSFEEIIEAYRSRVVEEQNNLCEMQAKAIEFKNALLAGYKEHVAHLNELIPYDDINEIKVRDEAELVDIAVSRASDKIKASTSASEISQKDFNDNSDSANNGNQGEQEAENEVYETVDYGCECSSASTDDDNITPDEDAFDEAKKSE